VGTFSEQANGCSVPAQFDDCVLCVGRIDGLKNQLNLLRAMRDLPIPLVLIGQPAPNHGKYFEMIKRECTPRTHLLGPIDHSKLPAYYRKAKVHALVSWMETTGLSSLEAGLCGCSLVITPEGDTREYFQDDAFYCQPGSVSSIRDAIVRAYAAPPNDRLKQRIRDNFTWEKAAASTLCAYRTALEQAH
jgi:glycosyltransferase involved in cell wall biosynthesis